MAKTIETRTEIITLDDDGVCRCRVKSTATHTLDDARENVEATSSLAGDRRVPLILDARDATNITREAREYYTGPENAEVVMATAMIIGSMVGRIIGNFLIRVNRPPFPFRLFSDETSANDWITQFARRRSEDVADLR